MSDALRLLAAFDSGELVRPSPDVLNLVDLIGPSEHLVLILADGFGMNFLGAMDSEDFAPRHLAVEL